jgi:predicted lipid-binding transport protein (Tim44 family)
MTPRRRALLVIAAALVLAVLSSAPALATAGGGSSGFGGGGGGGGGGRGAGIYILFQILIRIAIIGHGLGALVIIAAILLYLGYTNFAPQARGAWSDRRRRGRAGRRQIKKRQRRVELAAAEAAEEDPAFAPDAVRTSAADLFMAVQKAWSAEDHATLQRLVGPRLLSEWERRLEDFRSKGWHNQVEVLDPPTVEYVGLARRANGGGDQVVVRIEARMRDYVNDAGGHRVPRPGRLRDTITLREFWTLRRREGSWQLDSIEQGAEGWHRIQEQLVATSWSDEQALRDESLVEGATADAVPEGVNLAELADLSYTGDARAAALDLSLADGRFAPDVLEVSARRAVSAWAEAIDGDDQRMRALATPAAVRTLLHPGDPSATTRLVVRGPEIEQIQITGFDPAAAPPRMTVEVAIKGRRYIEDRATTAVVSGDPSRSTSFREHWTFALAGDDAEPWRIVAVDTPVSTR